LFFFLRPKIPFAISQQPCVFLVPHTHNEGWYFDPMSAVLSGSSFLEFLWLSFPFRCVAWNSCEQKNQKTLPTPCGRGGIATNLLTLFFFLGLASCVKGPVFSQWTPLFSCGYLSCELTHSFLGHCGARATVIF